MRRLQRLVFAFIVVFAFSHGDPAHAQNNADAERCVALFEEGVGLAQPYIILTDTRPLPRNEAVLRTAIARFDEAIARCPDHWPSMWYKGKALQALGDSHAALAVFRQAYEVGPPHPDVINEMTIEAVNSGELDFALSATQIGLGHFPDSLPLRARLALVLLLVGRLDESVAAADRALELAPGDRISTMIRQYALDVRDGRRPQPASIRDMRP